MQLLTLLVSFSSCFTVQCSAPLLHAPRLANGSLVSFALYLRHGVRTPLAPYVDRSDSGQWICDSESAWAPRHHYSTHSSGGSRRYFNQLDRKLVEFPPNCQSGDLLVQGMEQHHELGVFYQQYLVQELHFLPRLINPDLMKLRSSFVERTFRSGESFMAGFYPPATPNETITFVTGTDSADFLYPDPTFCQDLMDDWEKFLASDEFAKRREKARVLYRDFYDRINMTFDNENWMYIGDYFNTLICTGQDYPEFLKDVITDELLEQSQKDIGYYFSGHFNIRNGAAGSAIFRDLFNNLDDQYNGVSKARFYLYSAHDSTLCAILAAFGALTDDLPTYRSHIAFEVWEIDGEK